MTEKTTFKHKGFFSKNMISCDEAGFLISKSKDTRLSFQERMGMRMHLLTCHLCRSYAKQINKLNHLVSAYRKECIKDTCGHKIPEETKAVIESSLNEELKIRS
ncbi:MAG: hypothetical protein WD578_08055 [Bacteroidales bacterium]